MSQASVYSQRTGNWQKQTLDTYECFICVTTNVRQILELPCGHNLCLSCLYMICAHSSLACPFCRCRLSTWLRHNPDYSKLIIKREAKATLKQKNVIRSQPYIQRDYRTLKGKATCDRYGHISEDWLLAKQIYLKEIEEFRYTHGRITRSMANKLKTYSS